MRKLWKRWGLGPQWQPTWRRAWLSWDSRCQINGPPWLAQTRQVCSPSSALGGHRWGCSDRNTPSHPNSHNCRVALAHSPPSEHGVEGTVSWVGDQGNCRPSIRGGCSQVPRPTLYLQCLRHQDLDNMARECPTPALALNQLRGTEGMWLSPQPATATPANNRLLTFPPSPQPRLASMKTA